MTTSPGAAYSAQRNQRLLQKAGDEHYGQVGADEDDYQMNASDNVYSDNDMSKKSDR